MSKTVSPITTRTALLANDVLAHFKKVEKGHCARVDFLSTSEANAICQEINAAEQHNVTAYVLAKPGAQEETPYAITVDKAIELRNRKEEILCLFVPSDLVDAAYSSLANSFAIIDGQKLHSHVLRQAMTQLSPDANKFVRVAFQQLRGMFRVSDDQRLDFALAILQRDQAGELDHAGLELWRVGLISDATVGELAKEPGQVELGSKLEQNRRCAAALARPTKVDSPTRERVQSIKVDKETERQLTVFFKGRTLNDARSWSQALAKQNDLTFDHWQFPALEASDLKEVAISSFIDAKGVVRRKTKLLQPDGPGELLYADCSPKGKITVYWESDPPKPNNIGGWRVAIIPANEGDERAEDVELPERDLTAQHTDVTLNTDLDLPEGTPSLAVRVRVTAINRDGTPIINSDTGEEISAESMEFYLAKGIEKKIDPPKGPSKDAVANLAYGRLRYIVEGKGPLDAGEKPLSESDAQWSSKDLEYFNIKLNGRRLLQVGISESLRDLERRSIAAPREQCCYLLDVNDVHTMNGDNIIERTLTSAESEDWAPFWKTREGFFARLRKEPIRNVVEVADWTPELINAALRYVQAYKDLLEDLLEGQDNAQALREALSIDTILVRVAAGQDDSQKEEALVTLPIHPLRVAWLINYNELLRKWEEQLLALPREQRKYNLDLKSIEQLTPINVPPFAYHIDSATTFTFFQNLRFFHGVSLPTEISDPHRRYGDIAQIFGMAIDQGEYGDTHPEHLSAHIKNFLDLHRYVHTLVTTLVNPDRGDFFAEAIKPLLPEHRPNDDDESSQPAPTFQITAYTDSRHKSTLQAIEQVRQLQLDQQRYQQNIDQFLPGIMTTLRKINRLYKKDQPLPDAHIAVITDLTQPAIRAMSRPETTEATTTSFSLYGLICRFDSQFQSEQGALRWLHRIVIDGVRKPEGHPISQRYTDLLIELQSTLLNAGGYLLSGTAGTQPVLEVTLGERERDLLDKLHMSTNWVITLDRFFTLDYYDSPHVPELAKLANKYVLDYSPEFTDGLGHRMMVTTAWHEEIQSLLSQAMNELGFARAEQSVGSLLHHLKTISGRLALQALESPITAANAVNIGVVTAWLEQQGRMRQAVLIPVATYPRLFSTDGNGNRKDSNENWSSSSGTDKRRCDLVLVSLRRNIVEATFIDISWRRGQETFEELGQKMTLQMKNSATIMRTRFFNERRIDGALQRSYLANVLRFYFERALRYQLFDEAAKTTFLEHASRLEKSGLDFREHYEGYIINLDGEERKPFPVDDARITVLTADDFKNATDFSTQFNTPEPDAVVYDEGAETVESFVEDDEIDDRDDEDTPQGGEAPDESEPVGSNDGHTAILDGHNKNSKTTLDNETISGGRSVDDDNSNHDGHEATAENVEKTTPVVIGLGIAQGANVEVKWQPAVSGSPHIFVLGMSGQGKSWTVTRLITELGKQDVPGLVLDFHGQFADPSEPFVQAVHPNVVDAARGLPFSPFECSLDGGSGGWQANSYAVAEIFANVAELGDMQRDIVFTAIRDAYRAHGYTDEFGQDITNLGYPTPEEVLHNIEQEAQTRHSLNVVARCRRLLEMNLFRPREHAPELISLVRSGLVIDLHNLYVESLQQAAGSFVLHKIYKDMFSWGYAKRIRLAIVLDEAHRLAKDVTLPKIMREGRKFGVAVIVASQSMTDFAPDVLDNAGSKVIFRMNYPHSKKVAGYIRGLPGQDLAARIEGLGVGTAYVQTPDMQTGSVVKMHSLK